MQIHRTSVWKIPENINAYIGLTHVFPLLVKSGDVRPAAGNVNGSSLNNRGSNGNYLSRSRNSATNAYRLNFNSSTTPTVTTNNRFNGFSVRAVRLCSALANYTMFAFRFIS